MLTKEILNSHTLKTLRSEIKQHNDEVKVSGYSKLTKPKIVELMMEHKDKFMHIKHAEKKEKKAPKAKAKAPKAPKAKAPAKPKGTHKMPDGSEMTGKVHSKDSKPVKGKSKITIDLEKAKKAGVKLDLEKLKKAGVGIIEKKKTPAKPKAKPKKAKAEKKDLGTYRLEEAKPPGNSPPPWYKLPNGRITSSRQDAFDKWKKEGYSKVLFPKEKK